MNTTSIQLTAPAIKRSNKPKAFNKTFALAAIIRNPFPWPKPAA